jgi:carnitine 3-dehydrogenase
MTGKPVAIIGCGLIGESWAALMSAHGFDVRIWDPASIDEAVLSARLAVARAQVRAVAGSAEPEGRVTILATLAEAVADAGWVQENAPEDLALKRRLYAEIEEVSPSETVIASSTTALGWSELSAELVHPARFVTAHPFSPPHLMPLVEIFSPHAGMRRAAHDFYSRLGRVPVLLEKEAIGHIANRLSAALWREAVHIVAEGIADVAAVDAALVHGPGLRWAAVGAHMAYHLGGGDGGLARYLERLGPSQERRWASLGTPTLTESLCAQLVDGVQREAGGRSIATLSAARDAALVRILAARESCTGNRQP